MENVRKLSQYKRAIYGMNLPDVIVLTKDNIEIFFQDALKWGFSQKDANAMYLGKSNGKYYVTFSIGDYEETIDNIRVTVVHEIYGHGIEGYSDGTNTHYKAYFAEIDSQYWGNTTDSYKYYTVKYMLEYKYSETGSSWLPKKYNDAYFLNINFKRK